MPARSADDVRIETYGGPRDGLRPLFELAEDSAAELDSYIDAGRVLVAVSDGEIIGHLQLTGTGARQVAIKNMAVLGDRQGQGVGRLLVQAAVELVAAEGVTTVLVAVGWEHGLAWTLACTCHRLSSPERSSPCDGSRTRLTPRARTDSRRFRAMIISCSAHRGLTD